MARTEAQKRYAKTEKGKATRAAQRKRSYERNREQLLEKHREYYKKNAIKRRVYELERRKSNPEITSNNTLRLSKWRKTLEGIAARYKEHQKARHGRIIPDDVAKVAALTIMIKKELKRAKSK